MILHGNHVSGALQSPYGQVGGVAWSRSVSLLAPAQSLSLHFLKMPKTAKVLEVELLTDAIVGYNPFTIYVNGEPAYTRNAEAAIPAPTTVTLASTYANFTSLDVQAADTSRVIPATSPQPGTGAMPSAGINVNHARVVYPPIPGFPAGTSSRLYLQRFGGTQGEIASWDPAVGIDTTINLSLPADGDDIIVTSHLRDSIGGVFYPFDWTTLTDLRLTLALIQEGTGVAAITDRPNFYDVNIGAINTRYRFPAISLDRPIVSHYSVDSVAAFREPNENDIPIGIRANFPNDDQLTPESPAWPPDHSHPRAINWTHTNRPEFVTLRRTNGNYPAGTILTARAF